MSFFVEILKNFKLFHLCFTIVFVTSGLLINFIELCLYNSLRRFSKRAYRKINYYLVAMLLMHLLYLVEWWCGTELYLYVDKDDFYKYYGKEHAYCISNHTYEIDAILLLTVADRMRMIGNYRAFGKKSLQYLPLFGWAGRLSDSIFLERSFEKDEKIISKQLKELGNYPDPVFLLYYSEGTRFTSEKYKASEKFSRDKNLPELKYHLQPRTRGFVTSLPFLKGKASAAIYDTLITCRNDDPVKLNFANLIMGKPMKIHVYMCRIPAENVPTSKVELERFLRDLYLKKDKMKDSFVQTGDFFATSGVPRVAALQLKPRSFSWINMVIWTILVLCPFMYYFSMLLISGQLLYVGLIIFIIVTFIFLLLNFTAKERVSNES